jgi:outer membrane protein OmpA-like peptidoglycan-associated protein
VKRFIIPLLFCFQAVNAQTKPEPDAAGCVDSKSVPKLLNCRIDNCEQKESDHREVPVREDPGGQLVMATLDGESRSVMYECAAGMTPAMVVQQTTLALRTAHFEVPYHFAEKEGAVTAYKGELWVLVEAAARYYTLTEMKTPPPDFESITDAAGMAEALERYGHIPVYGIKFPAGRAELTPESENLLREIASMLDDHPQWRLRIESHTDNTGTKVANMNLSQRRATAVATWLAANGVKRLRLLTAGMGDSQPVGANTTEAGRAKNNRIELVKLAALAE